MAWNYRKRIKIIPGVNLNFSTSGISTSIGIRGANMTFGKKGTYLSTSIPGTGLYQRRRFANRSGNSSSNDFNPKPILSTEFGDTIFSADILDITSQDMQGIKEAIIAAHEQRIELKKDLQKVRASLTGSIYKLRLTYLTLIGLFKKSIARKIKADINAKKDAIKQLVQQIEKCHVALDIEFDPELKAKYDRLVSTFKDLSTSEKIWDIKGSQFQNTKETRFGASAVVKRTEVSFGIEKPQDIKSNFEPLLLKNANGSDFYFYPHFIAMYSSQREFTLIALTEIQFTHKAVRFIEADSIPADTKIIDKTWAKINKNGSPDKRFKRNYQIPVAQYGVINLKTDTGLNEEYQFSHYEYSKEFGDAFYEYQNTIKSIQQKSQLKQENSLALA
ncbi:DUF4236 domain-containing protein [Chryseobacterium sp. A301]